MGSTKTYAAGRRILDADSHIMEPPTFLTDVAPASIHADLAPIALGDDDFADLLAHSVQRQEKRASDPALWDRGETELLTSKGWGAFGDFDPKERSRAIDLLGFERQLVFPTASFPAVMQSPDHVYLDACEAMNRGMAAFCGDDDRLMAMAYIPMQRGPDDALRVLTQAVKDGCDFVVVDMVPPVGGQSFTHPDFDPVWAAFVEHKLLVTTHVGLENGWRPVRNEYFDNGRTYSHFRSDAPGDALSFLAIGFAAELFVGSLIFDGVLHRHPGLRFVIAELGASWVPGLVHFLDTSQRAFRARQDLTHLDDVASASFRKHFCVSPFAGEDVGWMIEAAGPELFMFSSDFPHHEGTDDPIRRFDKSMPNTPPDAVDAFYFGNLERILADVDA